MIERGLLDDDLRPHDRLGRLVPHRFNFHTFMSTIPGFASQFRTVPERFYTGKEKEAEVNCPCGATVVATTGDMIACADCRRIYVWMVKRLVVGNSPVREEVIATS